MEILKQTGKINICLVGMMGSIKSIIGKEISKIYNIKFYDTDEEIEKKEEKQLIKFLDKGEDYFRKIEEEISIFYLKKKKLCCFYWWWRSL